MLAMVDWWSATVILFWSVLGSIEHEHSQSQDNDAIIIRSTIFSKFLQKKGADGEKQCSLHEQKTGCKGHYCGLMILICSSFVVLLIF